MLIRILHIMCCLLAGQDAEEEEEEDAEVEDEEATVPENGELRCPWQQATYISYRKRTRGAGVQAGSIPINRLIPFVASTTPKHANSLPPP